jgi:hypothetical protein
MSPTLVHPKMTHNSKHLCFTITINLSNLRNILKFLTSYCSTHSYKLCNRGYWESKSFTNISSHHQYTELSLCNDLAHYYKYVLNSQSRSVEYGKIRLSEHTDLVWPLRGILSKNTRYEDISSKFKFKFKTSLYGFSLIVF